MTYPLFSSSSLTNTHTITSKCMLGDDKQRTRASKLCYRSLLVIQEKILTNFDSTLSIALRGLGDYSDPVRRFSAKSLRILVTFAPLVRNSGTVDDDDSSSSQIFKTKLLIDSPADASIIDFLKNVTNLVASNDSSTNQRPPIPGLSPNGLRDYQWEGVSWLTQLRRSGLGGILADDMGVGKTIQALTAIAIIRLEKMINADSNPNFNANPFLIVCPSMLILHWEQEIKKFFLPAIFTPRRYVTGETYDNSSVIIMSYDNIKRDYESFTKSRMVFEAIVLDEAHVIRNPKTAVAQAVFSLKGKFRIALSGTPIQNKIEEVWSLFNFLIPDFLGNFKEFNTNYILPIKKSVKERVALNNNGVNSDSIQYAINISTEGMDILRKLHKIILPFILRRTKNMVARELPSKTIIDLYCPLSLTQKKLYVDFQKKLRISDSKLEEELLAIRNRELTSVSENSTEAAGGGGGGGGDGDDDNTSNESLHPLKAFFYLRYLCVHPSLVIAKAHTDYKSRLINESGMSGKMDRLARLLVDSQVVLEEECDRLHDLPVIDGDIYINSDKKSSNDDSDNDDNDDNDNKNSNDNENDDDTNTTMTARSHFISAAKNKVVNESATTTTTTTRQKHVSKQQRLAGSNPNTTLFHRALIFVQHKEALDLVEEVRYRYIH